MTHANDIHIAFFGLGNMGSGMAKNLLKAGVKVTVFDLIQAPVDDLVNCGAIGANTPVEAVSNVNCVVSMLPAGRHVESLYGEILPKLKDKCLLIDCSTIEADIAKLLHERAQQAGHKFVDAPVSGGVAGAAAGSLTFIVGGSESDMLAAKPILEIMGEHCFHAGGPGAGQVAKICNNMLLAILMSGTSEALQLAVDNGIDAAVMSKIMQQSSGNNWTLEKYNPAPGVMPATPASNEYQGGFMVDLMNKDLALAMNAAASNSSLVPMGAMAKSLYQMHKKNGHGSLDFSSIFKAYSEQK
ncbi:3-hydroxyisobutyrate dehydrogenase [Glaciecola petra]|uniref:3-hydroxyisobutyrate dehydrogenase n=1 Tax=Glaciecola petra TaxID=3075602 RepID=A0ABU2ZP79_9ALTE|nr:3-hydroxyisobutyrate dehydrogenase [Aestuariibacter sp. P117]MDT0594434.1 3-hydroxyisobutyrate dehydrogenase [Aestuariibacter sp. P117]